MNYGAHNFIVFNLQYKRLEARPDSNITNQGGQQVLGEHNWKYQN